MLIKLWHHFSRRRQKQFVLVQILILLGSLFEMVSLGAVIPFLSVLVEPELLYQNKYLQPLIQSLEITETSQLTLPITLGFIVLILFSAIIRIVQLYVMVRFSFSTGADLSINIYRHTLYQDYAVHLARNSSVVINGIITKTKTVTTGIIHPVLSLISASVTIIGIIIVLLALSISVTLTAFISFGGLYLIVIYFTRGLLKDNSVLIAEKSDLMVKSLQEGLEGIREVIINNTQQFYIQLYKNSDLQMRAASRKNEFIIASPRFGMEAIGIVIIALFAYLATLKLGGLSQFIPLLGAFVLGAQRLLPAIQKGYGSYSRIKGSKHSLLDVISLLDQSIPDYANCPPQIPIPFLQSIELKNLCFQYLKDSPWVLKNINLTIPKGSVIGIVGTTGCGKSTLLDVVMGLLLPTSGELRVDGQLIDSKNRRAWQTHIANVSQHIYLADGTIEENIAFGIPNKKIDHNRVKKAAQKAQIADLIEEWDNGYQALVGERGMRLSGGQRQRVGLARAFYKQSDVLILDEATSALDNETELAVMDAIERINEEITIIIIAHRLSTLKSCDKIVKFGKNYAIEILSYKEVISLNSNTDDIDIE
tara:strand:- start:15114 stop:16889 length:1776 start_codon:yes stop_codon:yes gene_type:complete